MKRSVFVQYPVEILSQSRELVCGGNCYANIRSPPLTASEFFEAMHEK